MSNGIKLAKGLKVKSVLTGIVYDIVHITRKHVIIVPTGQQHGYRDIEAKQMNSGFEVLEYNAHDEFSRIGGDE